jgi:TolA-binding protein
MDRTLLSRWILAGAVVLAMPGIGVAQEAQEARGQDQQGGQQEQQVDPATKQLLAANGLYTRGLYKLAADEYQQFLQANPKHAQATAARYALAVCRYRLKEYGPAVEELRKVLGEAKFEQRDEALAVLGHCELSQGHFEQAVGAFDELIGKFPSSKHAELGTLSRAQALYLGKKYPEAAKGCEDYLAKYSGGAGRADAMYFLALSQRAQDKNDAAAKTAAELVEKFPDSSHRTDALLLEGQGFEAIGKFEQAIGAYDQMLSSAPEPRKADALYSLGIASYKAGKYDGATKNLTALLESYPKSAYSKPAKLQLGMAQLAGGRTNQARSTLEAVAREDSERAGEAQYGLAQCDIADKRYQQAVGRLDQLAAATPAPANIAQVRLDRAVCRMELGQFQQAAEELQAIRDQYASSPQVAEATYRQAFCLHRLAKYEQSHALCGEVEKLKGSGFAEANAELDAENLFVMAKYGEAKARFEKLARGGQGAKDDGRKLRFTFRVGQCDYFAGDYAKAAGTLATVAGNSEIARDADLRQVPLLLGDAYLQQGKFSEAAEALEKYAGMPGADRPQGQYKLGLAKLKGNDVEGAERAFAMATEGSSDSQWVQRAWFERGQIELKEKQYDQAASSLRRVLNANASAEVAGPAEYQLGWAEFGAKRYQQAASAWHEMSAKFPKDKLAADAAFQEGVALREGRQLDQAVEVLQGFAASHPDNPNAVKAKQLAAACLRDLNKNDESRKLLELISASGGSAGGDTILYDLAWAQRDAKQMSEAQATYRRLLSEQPGSKLVPAARTELAELLYDDKRYDEAVTLLEQVVGDKNADAKVVALAEYRLGWCYQALKKPDKAAVAFAAYQKNGGGSDEMAASALLQAGIAYAADQKFENAEKCLGEMIQKFPGQKDAPVALLKLGEVQAERSEFDASEQTYRGFLEKNPKSEFGYRAQFGIGWALENRKLYDEARKAYEKVIAATNGPTAARAQFQIGETYLAQGKFKEAVPALLAVDDVYKYADWSARALFEAGRAFEQMNQPDQAKKQYTDILNKYKDAPEADMARQRLQSMTGA